MIADRRALILLSFLICIEQTQCTRTLATDQTITFMMNDVLATSDAPSPQPKLTLLFPRNRAETFTVPARTPATNWLQVLASLQAFEAGKLTVIDEMLRGHVDMGEPQLGRVKGMYVASSDDENHGRIVAMKATFGTGEDEDSLQFFGALRADESESEIAVVGGTGKFESANGYAVVKSAFSTKNRNKILSVSVHLR